MIQHFHCNALAADVHAISIPLHSQEVSTLLERVGDAKLYLEVHSHRYTIAEGEKKNSGLVPFGIFLVPFGDFCKVIRKV